MNLLRTCLLLLLCALEIHAQTLQDAIRYSVYEPGGTARSLAVGGSLSALGADFAVVSLNPAGLATFRRSEFVFSPTLVRDETQTLLQGEGNPRLERTKTTFNFNALGLVIANRPIASSWSTANFAIGVNRLANFHQNLSFEGVSEGSITDRFLELADGFTPDQLDAFEAGLAYDALAIYNPTADNTFYVSDFAPGEQVEKSQRIRRTGGLSELVFSFAGNYEEEMMFGATIGVPFLSFEESKFYQENDTQNNNPVFDELVFREELQTSGIGINLKLGFIYRFEQAFRLGLAVHTPTAFSLEDNFFNTMNYRFSDPNFEPVGEVSSPEGNFEYKFRTPWRYFVSAGYLFGKQGFVHLEGEYVQYPGANFKFNNTSNPEDLQYQDDLNGQIEEQLANALNLRLGGEYVYKVFRFRGGYRFQGAVTRDADEPTHTLSAGAGVRLRNFYFDVAYSRRMSEGEYQPYLTFDAPRQIVQVDQTRQKFMATLGFKF
ncbi:MAG: hypothetical protein D6765_09050 [Bacteroidetes bacterium]|nr:MAG: hypothetical protein D6765_09050 [Bacteroidota bacterium]